MVTEVTTATSVVVNFTDTGVKILMEEASKPGSTAFKYFRVHTAVPIDQYLLLTSSGTVARYLPGQKKVAKQYITFSDSAESALKYPAPSNVKFEVIGNLVTKSGEAPTLSVDTVNGVIRATEKCHGVVKVIFDAPYDMWKATFEGSSEGQGDDTYVNATANKDVEDDKDVSSAPMLILAYVDNTVRNTLTLSPLKGGSGGEGASTPPRITVHCEIDPKYPPQLRAGGIYASEPKISMGCRVRVYPSGDGPVTVSSGRVVQLPEVGTKNCVDSLNYSGSAIANLKYQANGGMISHAILGIVYDMWGKPFLPTVAPPGSMVTSCTWIGERQFTDPKIKQLGPQEVGITSGGLLMPCHTSLVVTYSATYNLYEFVFAVVTANPWQDIVAFTPSVLTAQRGVGDITKIGAGSINLEPKTSRGK